ncbi:head GIN domain-containing protein [Aurantibacter sp.]|uniref:head GIN domain-containing protein n=1 Tax=Aurantibacter sp. TaxID=2807103 RepID=UPI003262CEA0
MTTLSRIAIGFILAFLATSCGMDINIGDFGSGVKGNGEVVTDKRKVTDDFTEISASEGIEVYVTQANEFKINVEGDSNIIDLIGTDINNGKLRIHAIENIGRATKKVFVSLPEITALKSSSGAHMDAEGLIKSDELDINSSSGSSIEAEVATNDLDIDASSGANLTITGKTQMLSVDGSSGANINTKDLQSKICDADASSGSNISVNVMESLTADATSGGNIRYDGDPTVKKNKSVSGSVHQY